MTNTRSVAPADGAVEPKGAGEQGARHRPSSDHDTGTGSKVSIPFREAAGVTLGVPRECVNRSDTGSTGFRGLGVALSAIRPPTLREPLTGPASVRNLRVTFDLVSETFETRS
ncbi:hypothetical protein HG826_25125 [Streptomyces sp. GMY01]|uniref:hypothetical protein n=1 Tax=Streptomyces sp. GMY02 TaxID=1333528 RepID=UPI001469A8A1|nr:hypothetical protein [Streptomyces sp. GMY02]NMO36799.1 hypothetical protein [Streptomyces sp. GMY02]